MSEETRKLPLWRDAMEKMEPIQFGKSWTREWLEKALGAKAEDIKFNMGLLQINENIRCRGFKLTQRGLKGRAWFILAADSVEDELKREQSAAKRCYQRAVELGAGVLANPEANLTDGQVKALDHQLRNAAARLALTARRNPQVIAQKVSTEAKPETKRITQ